MRALGLLALTIAALALGGCSMFESKKKTPIDLGVVGPDTKEQVQSLPKGLHADTQNSLHTGQELRGDEPKR